MTESSEKINVLHLRSSRGSGGGPEKTIMFSAKEADPDSFCLHIAYLKSRDDPEFDLDDRARKLGIVSFMTIDEDRKIDIPAMKRLLSILRRHNIHILHCHCYKSDLYGLILSRYHKMKLVTTAHGPLASLRFFWSSQNWRVRYIYDTIDLMILKYFDHVLIVSESMRETIARYGVEDNKLTWVKNSIDSEFFRKSTHGRAELRTKHNIPEDAIVLGAVGRLNGEKDYPNFLEAARILLQKHDDLYFTIAGSGSLGETLRKKRDSLGLSDRVVFLGHFHDIRQVYNMMDVYVLSSTREGLPNTVLEAMAMEVPIVATDVDGVCEAVSHNQEAILVSPRDSAQLASGILRVLADSNLRDRITDAARKRVEHEFGFANRMRKVEDIYRSVMYGQKSLVPVTN